MYNTKIIVKSNVIIHYKLSHPLNKVQEHLKSDAKMQARLAHKHEAMRREIIKKLLLQQPPLIFGNLKEKTN